MQLGKYLAGFAAGIPAFVLCDYFMVCPTGSVSYVLQQVRSEYSTVCFASAVAVVEEGLAETYFR